MDDNNTDALKDVLGNHVLDFYVEGMQPSREMVGGGLKETAPKPSAAEPRKEPQPTSEREADVKKEQAELENVRGKLAVEMSQSELFHGYEQVSRLGRSVVQAVREREHSRYTPYIDPQRFDRRDVTAVRKASEVLTPDDLHEARRGSYALTLEAAAQIAEVQLPRTQSVREDAQSLDDMARIVRSGAAWGQEFIKTGERDVVLNEARKAIARRAKQHPDQVKATDQQLLEWTGQQFSSAHARLQRSTEAVRDYHRR